MGDYLKTYCNFRIILCDWFTEFDMEFSESSEKNINIIYARKLLL